MSTTVTGLAATVASSPLASTAEALVQRAHRLDPAAGPGESAKIRQAGHDFEALLLAQWLEQAETSLASLPGGADDDGDAGSSSMQGIAMQSLGESMASSGGIGIARMITRQLERSGPRAAASEVQSAAHRNESATKVTGGGSYQGSPGRS